MALNSEAKKTNIKRSLENYLYSGISNQLGIDFEGVPFEDTLYSEWIQPRIVDSRQIFLRQGSSSQYADEVNLLFQINIFVKKSSVTSVDRVEQVRDIVYTYFKPNQKIALRDHDSGSTTLLNYFKVRDFVNDFLMPETNELFQYVMAWELDYTRLTDNA